MGVAIFSVFRAVNGHKRQKCASPGAWLLRDGWVCVLTSRHAIEEQPPSAGPFMTQGGGWGGRS